MLKFQKEKNFIFLSSADYILFRFEFLLFLWHSTSGKKDSASLPVCLLPFSSRCLSLKDEVSLGQAREKGKIYWKSQLFAEIICCSSWENILEQTLNVKTFAVPKCSPWALLVVSSLQLRLWFVFIIEPGCFVWLRWVKVCKWARLGLENHPQAIRNVYGIIMANIILVIHTFHRLTLSTQNL